MTGKDELRRHLRAALAIIDSWTEPDEDPDYAADTTPSPEEEEKAARHFRTMNAESESEAPTHAMFTPACDGGKAEQMELFADAGQAAPSFQEVQDRLRAASRHGGRDRIIKAFSELGVDRLSAVRSEDYPHLLAMIEDDSHAGA